MPNWEIHLEIAKRVNNYIKYEGEELEKFLIGNVLPDVNNGYLVKNVSRVIDKKITHFEGKNVTEKTYMRFYEKYKTNVNTQNPLFLGYFMHLYVDYTWNADFYNNLEKDIKEKYSKEEIRKMKQHDFRVYRNKYIKNSIKVINCSNLVENIKKIDEVKIDKSDILEIGNFLAQEEIFEGTYKYYTEDRLDKLVNTTVDNLIKLVEESRKIE